MEELARVYSRALFEVAREQASSTCCASSSASSPTRSTASRELSLFFFSPYFSTQEKQSALGRVLERRRRERS